MQIFLVRGVRVIVEDMLLYVHIIIPANIMIKSDKKSDLLKKRVSHLLNENDGH